MKQNPKPTADHWDALIERYFEAQTTAEEEAALRRFLCSPQGRASRYDEVRAVMGFLAVGRSLHQRSAVRTARPTPLWHRVAGIAASVVVAVGLSVAGWHVLSADKEVYVAYVDGQKITDRDEVLRLMCVSFDEVAMDEPQAEMEAQLGDMFSVMDE